VPCLQVALLGHRPGSAGRTSQMRQARGKNLESISRMQPQLNGENDAGKSFVKADGAGGAND
jgi:hypothetical protein